MIARKSVWSSIAALAISAALHAVAIIGARIPVAPAPELPPALQAHLVPLPPAPPVALETPAPPRALRARTPRPPRVVAMAPATHSAEPPAFVVDEDPPASAETAPAMPEPLTAQAAAPADADANLIALAPPTALAAPEPPPLPSLPRRGRIGYTLFLGTDKFEIGRTIQNWEVEDGTYRIGSTSETTGLAAVLRSERRTYLSTGDVTPAGLKPRSFLMSRQRRGETEVARASFDWNAGEITWGSVDDKHQGALPAGSQDFLSLMYQLSLSPPAGSRLSVPLTTGTKFETYELDVLPEESIDTPLGTLRALPLKQVRKPGAETIQIWLAADYRYLPVMLRFFGRDGEPTGEQVVNEIRLAE